MTAQVIETKRQPPLWKVKAVSDSRRYSTAPRARAQAEEYATKYHGGFEVRAKEPTGKQVKRGKAGKSSEEKSLSCMGTLPLGVKSRALAKAFISFWVRVVEARASDVRDSRDKSFLLLFLEKEGLSSFRNDQPQSMSV